MTDRGMFLGGSDIAAVLGVNPYKSRYALYLEKIGAGCEAKQTEAMMWGGLLEPVVAARFAEEKRLSIEKAEQVCDPLYDFLRATPDYLVEDDGVLEVKTSGDRRAWGPDGSADVPEHYAVQAMWYAGMTGRTGQIWIAALIGGQEMRTYRLRWDAAWYRRMREAAVDFWLNCVVPRIPPSSAPSERAAALSTEMPDDLVLAGTAEHEDMMERYLDLRDRIAGMQDDLKSLEDALKDAIGRASALRTDACEASWTRGRSVSSVDWKGVAMELGASPEVIERHTARGTTRRVFSVRRLQ